jgi:LPS-assembly protein
MARSLLLLTSALFSLTQHSAAVPLSSDLLKGGGSFKNDEPILIESDDVTYDSNGQEVRASGNVFVHQAQRLLRADEIIYQRIEDVLKVKGQVWLRELRGDFIFFDQAELTNKMSDGIIHEPKALLIDDSRAAGRMGRLYNKNKTILWKGVYSPCNVCKENPENPPLWQLKAGKIIHDKEEQMLMYHNAWMELEGVPVFYTPYFSHPDPTVKRKTGLLRPSPGTSTDFGYLLTLPFFWAIDDSKDLTFMPVITTREGLLVSGEYRQQLVNSAFKTSGSFVGNSSSNKASKNNKNSLRLPPRHRWHFFFNSRHELSDDYLLTVDINRASDTTYLRRYHVLTAVSNVPQSRQSTLTSTIALEQFKSNSYGIIQGYSFQSDTPKTNPRVIPSSYFTYETDPGRWSETWDVEGNLLNLMRKEPIPGRGARHVTRLSGSAGFQLPYITPLGDVWQLRLKARGDGYFLKDYANRSGGSVEANDFQRRFYPQASLSWHFPFINKFECSDWIVEPAAMIVAGSTQGNKIQIPNEDSSTLIIDQTNIFLPNRFYGYDKVDTGSRVIYGFYDRHYFVGGRKLSLFIGQTVRLDHDQVLPNEAGEDRNASDLVVGVKVIPGTWLTGDSRFLVSRATGEIQVAETQATLDTGWFTLSAGHTYYSRKYVLGNQKVSQLNWSFSTPVIEKFSFTFSEVRNLDKKKSAEALLSRSAQLNYHHQCIIMSLGYSRSNYKDRDLKPSHTFLLSVDFKNLGSIDLFKKKFGGDRGTGAGEQQEVSSKL